MLKLLPLYGVHITLRFSAPAEFTPFHNAAVDAFLRHMLNMGERYGQHFSILCPENGRLKYNSGDTYRFGIICDQGGLDDLNTLIQRLRRLPITAVVKDPAAPLRDNLQLIELNDMTDGKPVSHGNSLTPFDYSHITEIAKSLDNDGTHPIQLHWRFIAPVRLLKADHTQHQGEKRFIQDSSELTAPLLLQRTLHTLQQLGATPTTAQDFTVPIIQAAQLLDQDLFWVDTPYYNKNGHAKTLGGLMGDLTLKLPAETPLFLLEQLVLAQYLGIGQRRALGWGKYDLTLTKASHSPRYFFTPLKRAQSLKELAFSPEPIEIALLETEQKDSEVLSDDTLVRLNSALGQIHAGDYHPPALQGIKLPKDDGSTRLLAVAPLWDRILQKSAAVVLTPMLNALYSTASFAYRQAHSRQQVRYEILQAWREGYRWVYESDIDDFFDAIDRGQLIRRLENVLGKDPLWQIIERWLSRPVIVDGVRVERPKGIPQGSPLSPLLANFILDDFDADLQRHGFRLLRFADDFIVLAKTKAQAETAHHIVQQSLSELKLQLNRDKTRVVHLSEGLKFLGYLFVEDVAIEIGGDTSTGQNIFTADDPPKTLPPWMSALHMRQATPIQPEDRPVHHIGEQSEQGSFIIVSGERHILTTDNDNLIVRDTEDNLVQKCPWEQIYGVLAIGLHTITLPALHQALRHHIPIHLASRTGEYLGQTTTARPAQNHYKHWFTQLAACQRQDFSLHIAKQLIAVRIHNQRTTLLRRARGDNPLDFSYPIQQLKKLYHKALNAKDIPQLLGYEGTATRTYLQCFNTLLPAWAQFDRRSKRPPQDPFNVLLSLGYTVLYSQIDCILQAHGLLTWKGCLHQQSPNHAALASDMMEPYRHLVEQSAISWARNHGKSDDFTREENQPGLRMHAEARRRYLRHLAQRLNQPLGGEQNFYNHFAAQTRALKQAIKRIVPEDFTPYRSKP